VLSLFNVISVRDDSLIEWDGKPISEATLQAYLKVTSGMNPVPVTQITPGTVIHTGNGSLVVSTPTAAPGQTTGQPPATDARQTPIATTAMAWLEFVLGFLAPLGLGGAALYLTRGRSFQSATGMLYLCVSFIFIGEILARGLLLFPIFG